MEDDMEESQLFEQPAKLPALRYFGLLSLIILSLALLVASIVISI